MQDISDDLIGQLDWGLFQTVSKYERDYVESEIRNGVYTKTFDVEYGDIVFDIGASVGPFTASILHKSPYAVHCFEPHKDLFNTLSKNLSKFNNVKLNCLAISDETKNETELDSVFNFGNISNTVSIITFSDYIRDNNIEKIDFLKTDCEGGEWSIFNERNYNWIISNVRKVSGEFHCFNLQMKHNFIKFRDLYLTKAKNILAFTSNKDAIVNEEPIWDNNFIINNLNYCNISFEFEINKFNNKKINNIFYRV